MSVGPSDDSDKYWKVFPKPGLVLRWDKIYENGSAEPTEQTLIVNIVHCRQIPAPTNLISAEELGVMFETKKINPKKTIPLNLDEPRDVEVTSGKKVKTVDVIINTEYFKSYIDESKDYFQIFYIMFIVSHLLDDKYKFKMDPNDFGVSNDTKYFGTQKELKIAKRSDQQIAKDMEREDLKRMKEHARAMEQARNGNPEPRGAESFGEKVFSLMKTSIRDETYEVSYQVKIDMEKYDQLFKTFKILIKSNKVTISSKSDCTLVEVPVPDSVTIDFSSVTLNYDTKRQLCVVTMQLAKVEKKKNKQEDEQ
uniref:PIH1 domain-containing protein n=1 Tax=Caenorhabditis tropicalis TaxID=1561998 RepID=A0A1I7TRH6_9PELO